MHSGDSLGKILYCDVDLMGPLGANVVVDGRDAVQSTVLTAEERGDVEIDSIVRQAHEEYEEFACRHGIAEMPRRLVTTTWPSDEPAKHDLDDLQQLMPNNDLKNLAYLPL
ncbi:hypothetical protein AWZ03_010912 [Drosophila navojoa]|uniref:Uncharacterized protein n=1 Tax=Drosophila navojoa TaxID=7232 RepID=A0A484B1D8_DRONA|nr:hypothetical protein AWZ03_010912 [Drosophila navojoa]